MKELELEAEKYGYKQYGNSCGAKQERKNCIEDFVTGATSDAAKQYWYKQFEKQKLEFAIEQLNKLESSLKEKYTYLTYLQKEFVGKMREQHIRNKKSGISVAKEEIRRDIKELEQKLSEL